MTNQKIIKTPNLIKEQLESWFFKYESIDEYNGTEQLTLFNLLTIKEQSLISQKCHLNTQELGVFRVTINSNEKIIITTSRFIRLQENQIEDILFENFEGKEDLRAVILRNQDYLISNKREKSLNPLKDIFFHCSFGLKTKQGIKHWNIPTREIGMSFWNIAKRCKFIGKKYTVYE